MTAETAITAETDSHYRKSTVKMLSAELSDRQVAWEAFSDQWFVRAQAQEDALIKQGVDAEGLTEWSRAWLVAWNDLDHDAADLCVTTDVQWEDPTMYDEHVASRADFRVYCGQFWHAMPDLQFYPADDMWVDAPDGNLRGCIPWSAIGTFTDPFYMWPAKRTSPVLAPNGGNFEFHGVDRYNLVRCTDGPGGWQIRYGKTNYDILNVMTKIGVMPALTSHKARPMLAGYNAIARAQLAARKTARLLGR